MRVLQSLWKMELKMYFGVKNVEIMYTVFIICIFHELYEGPSCADFKKIFALKCLSFIISMNFLKQIHNYMMMST